jgi:hypothetical protein
LKAQTEQKDSNDGVKSRPLLRLLEAMIKLDYANSKQPHGAFLFNLSIRRILITDDIPWVSNLSSNLSDHLEGITMAKIVRLMYN